MGGDGGEASGEPDTEPSGMARAPITVLLADDEPGVRRVLAKLIGLESDLELVGAAADAEEAVELAAKHRPHVALIDIGIPKGTGVEATRGIRAASPATKVVALSGYGDRDHVTKMLAAGAVGYLVKAASVDVVGAIRAVERGESVLSREITGDVVGALSERLATEEEIDASMRRRAGEIRALIERRGFSMAFQPIFDLRRDTVAGVEALARFGSSPLRSTEAWFAEAWDLGLGLDLELAVVDAALDTASQRPDGVYLAVNVSPLTITSAPLLSLLERAPHASSLVLEVTEHTVVEDYEALNGRLDELRSRGIRIAVDDAGAGYASFRHILRLHPDLIKLDVSIVADVHNDPAQQALAASLVTFADKIGCAVVAEGIEAPGQLKCLAGMGIDYGQGYFLARPADALDDLVAIRPG
ncbi:MAG TPA: EAL domain-containing protein [Acidimicrobiales bacterium]|nr:EAL domain-containing protein [Acidimicrobiales bacterium]